ncbi:MAG: type VI secretion system membrane subunit TssM [Steroidobacteraceae bacterium]
MALLKSKTFIVILGLLLLAAIIWFAGPYFAFAGHALLAGTVARLVAILILAVVYAAYVQLRQLKSVHSSKQLAEKVAGQEEGSAGGASGGGGSGDAAQLRKRFDEAIEALKKSGKKGASLYDLPWYVIIGPPGAGKTTVLVNSGLNFPLAQKFGKEAVRGVGGTRNCDWWFTDEAILLDTAGRYTTQDSNAKADASGWSAFLQLLRKFRGHQPINGVIVAVSAMDLLTLGEREREQHVSAIRERLDELGRELRIRVPVYFLVTKCDLIAGFAEFFDDLSQEARAQVWGTTFPIETTESAAAAGAFAAEFDGLIERLQQRVLARMDAERDPRRRAGILAFPQQVSLLKPVIDDLLRCVFTASGFDRPVLLRGVYFTSGTQEGSPIDRMLGAIARSFGVTSAVAPPAAGRGKAYFIERLLKAVIFPEAGLAGVNRAMQARMIAARSGAYIACLVLLVLIFSWLLVSYEANAAYVEQVATATKSLPSGDAVAGATVDTVIPELDSLRDLTAVAEQYRGHVPWHMRAGLYRGAAIGDEARAAYTRDLNATLVPVLRARFEQALQANVAAPDRLYEYLKGYLMLGSAAHRDADHLRYLADAQWREMYAQDPTTAQRLDDHFEQLLTDDRLSSVSLDSQAVERARVALRSASMPVLVYDRLKLSYLNDTQQALRLDIAAGTGASVLVRRSGTPLSDPVPALYTRAVFREINSRRRYQMVEEFLQDSWVFGGDPIDLRSSGTLVYDVMNLYETDYLRYWDGVVKDVGIRSAADTQGFIDTLGIVSSPASPLKGFLQTVATNTDLLAPDTSAAGKAASAASALADAKLNALKKIMGPGPQGAPPPGTRVTQYFAPIRQLVAGAPGQAPIDQMLAALAQQYQRLNATGSGVGQQSALDPQVQAATRDARQSLTLLAKQLPAPLGNLVSDVGVRTASIVGNEARGELGRLYASQVVSDCSALVAGRYPLDPTSATDAAPGDFAHVFGPGGVFDSFFRDHLAQLVDTSRSPWRWRAGAAAGPASMLQQFERAQRIRDVFFGTGSQTPQVRFNLLADTLDPTVTAFRMSVDGQSFQYQHGPVRSVSMQWPGSSGQASFEFDSPAGPIAGPAFQGPWALFRLLDQARVESLSGSRYRLTFSAGGKSMSAILDAASIRNPFARNVAAGFRCTL